MHFFELVSELGNGHFVPYEFIRDNNLDWGACHSNSRSGVGARGSIEGRDPKFSAKSVCRVGVGRAMLLVGRS